MRNTGSGRCSFIHSYLDSFDDLRSRLRPERGECMLFALKKNFFLFMALGLSSFVTVTVFSVVRLKEWNLKVILSFYVCSLFFYAKV